ncbi:MAG: glycosyltransferase [Cyclobacteriaceae bacterium]|jgi:glycosyltransferase involved in cell wall biosynthesis|nr:glycosyltransferase [Cytophagales bacterium]MCZ8327962.1 glycosyltransferase [Cyclobacteriaceae bacterium]
MITETNWPQVTIYTLVYNTGSYVIEAIESVIKNDYPNIQHIIIDDCSTDNQSVQVVENWINENNYPCIFIKHDANKGVCYSLNEVLSLATGKYLMGIGDDVFTPTRIIDHVSILEKESYVAVVFGDVAVIDSKSKIISDSYFQNHGIKIKQETKLNLYKTLLHQNVIPAVGASVRTDLVKQAGGFDENLVFEDWDLWLRLAKNQHFYAHSKRAAFYRKHETSITNTKTLAMQMSNVKTLLKHTHSPEFDANVQSRMLYFTEEVYKINVKQARTLYKAILLKTQSLKSFFFYLITSLRIPYSFFKFLVAFKRR